MIINPHYYYFFFDQFKKDLGKKLENYYFFFDQFEKKLGKKLALNIFFLSLSCHLKKYLFFFSYFFA